MNYSDKYKIVWLAPERCATRIVSHIFKDYDFFYKSSSEGQSTSLCEPYHSHGMKIFNGYEDYEIVCSIRNPYDRVLSIFTNLTTVGSDQVFSKGTKDIFIRKFEYFVEEVFSFTEYKKLVENSEKYPIFNNYISKLTFNELTPAKFIRMENLKEDLNKLTFLSESEKWNSGHYENFIKENKFISKKNYDFTQVYTWKSAKKVYEFYKKIFFLCEYDPFSFTNEILSETDKKKFLHGII